MKTSELVFDYPADLIATHPQYPSRVLVHRAGVVSELLWSQFLTQFQSGDVLVLNDTKVLKRRVFSEDGQEILFLDQASGAIRSVEDLKSAELMGAGRTQTWSVLFPAKKLKLGDKIQLPLGLSAQLVEKGIPQTLRLSEPVDETYFEKVGELPLPPYIQKARNERHNREGENQSYQTWWAEKPGSLAAPTASLHFSPQDLESLKAKGVEILTITLHVGLGTFLPVTTETLEEHVMHAEWVEIPESHWQKIQRAKVEKRSVWALGTTVVRSLESQALGRFGLRDGRYSGTTDLMIRPGFQFQVVDRLLTNFHQPQSTLMALVMAFAGKENVLNAYRWAIEKKFRLFSYGDLSYWWK
ncbi:MAG: tRNA preQ1(34) S-adenosylmethionine ribosyltransferase-isomerase QueA [Bdellovibrionaceae bacterium]|nr:tRNA preQ1(34) S-adenosylmethionine ribosyltransferase-isomerase QueA [Pseudobdellovibrionaceae bacterium]